MILRSPKQMTASSATKRRASEAFGSDTVTTAEGNTHPSAALNAKRRAVEALSSESTSFAANPTALTTSSTAPARQRQAVNASTFNGLAAYHNALAEAASRAAADLVTAGLGQSRLPHVPDEDLLPSTVLGAASHPAITSQPGHSAPQSGSIPGFGSDGGQPVQDDTVFGHQLLVGAGVNTQGLVAVAGSTGMPIQGFQTPPGQIVDLNFDPFAEAFGRAVPAPLPNTGFNNIVNTGTPSQVASKKRKTRDFEQSGDEEKENTAPSTSQQPSHNPLMNRHPSSAHAEADQAAFWSGSAVFPTAGYAIYDETLQHGQPEPVPSSQGGASSEPLPQFGLNLDLSSSEADHEETRT